MPAALTLIVFVAVGEGDDATSRAMLRATRSALGAESQIAVREARQPPTDAQALAAEEQAHADGVVEVVWSDAAHRQAKLRVHVARTGRWIRRSIGFQASDAGVERGRTIGFAVASMLPEAGAEIESTAAPTSTPEGPDSASVKTATESPPAPAPAPAPAAPAPAPTPRPATPPAATPASGSQAPAAAADRPMTTVPSSSTAAIPRRLEVVALDVTAIGAASLGGDSDALGASAAIQWFPLRPLAFRLGGGARAGSLQRAQATTLVGLGSAGVVLYPLRASPGRPVGLWLRADYIVQRQSMTHLSADDPAAVTFERWLSGMDALVGADWRFAPDVGIVAGAGAEDVFSTTYVQVRGAPVATIPPLRGVAEAGFRLRF